MNAHAEPSHCRHSDCTCPEFEPSSPSDSSVTLLGPCDLCDHACGWHLPPMRLSAADATALKRSHGEALEHCKSRGCGCPVWTSAEGGKECALCSCKKGWHKWKETRDVQSPSSPPSLPYPVPMTAPISSLHYNTQAVAGPSSPPALVAPPLRPPPRPPTPPRPYIPAPTAVSPVPTPASALTNSKGKERAVAFELMDSEPERISRHEPPHRASPPHLRLDTSPPRHAADPKSTSLSPGGISNMSMKSEETFQTIATMSTSGSRYEEEEDSEDDDSVLTNLNNGLGGFDIGEGASTWGGARVRDPDSTRSSFIEPEVRSSQDFTRSSPVNATVHTASARSATGSSAGSGSRRMSESNSTEFTTPPASLKASSIRSAFGRRGSVHASTAPIPIVSTSPRQMDPRVPVGSEPQPLTASPTSSARGPPHRGASFASSSIGTTSGWSVGDETASVSGLERVFSNRSFGPVSSGPKIYSTKSLDLQVRPALDSSRFSPGQEFHFELTLGSKLSLASFTSIEVRLVGNSYACLDPPDDHDFLVLATSIHPSPPRDVTVGLGQRTFAWTMVLPEKQTCACAEPHSTHRIPSSYTGQHWKVSYRLELVAKKPGRLTKSEKLSETFIVYSPLSSAVVPLPMTLKTTPMEQGRDGPWLTATSRRLTTLDAQKSKLISSELAYQVVPSTTSTYVRVPYKITLTFDTQTSGSTYLNQAVLSQLEREFTLVISRRVIFLSSGGKKKEKMEELPPLKVGHVEKEKSGPLVTLGQSGLTCWQIGGVIEVDRREVRSVVTCNVQIRYYLSARAPLKCGLDQPIEAQARGVNFEVVPASAAVPVASTSVASPAEPSHSTSSGSNVSPRTVPTGIGSFGSIASSLPPSVINRSPTIASTSTAGTRSFSALTAARPPSPEAPSPATSSASGPSFTAPALPHQRDNSTLDFPLDYDELGLHEEPPPPFEPFAADSETTRERGGELVGFEYMSDTVS